MPQDIVEKYHIHIVPFRVIFGEEIFYMKGNFGDLTVDEFYTKVEQSEELPTTSLPSPKNFETVFNEALKDGEYVIAILISKALSGTFQNAVKVVTNPVYRNVILIDSKLAASALGLVVIEAAKMALMNTTKDEIIHKIEELIPLAKLVAVMDNLDMVYRSGRVSFMKKFLVDALKIKPILHFKDGKIASGGILRRRIEADKALFYAAKKITENSVTDLIIIWHVRSHNIAQQLKTIMENNNPQKKEIRIIEAGPVIGVHVGIGSVAFMYIGNYNQKWLKPKKKDLNK